VPITGIGGPSWGGGILVNNLSVSSVALHLSDVILERNTALTGGGLYAVAGTIDLSNSTVRKNAATDGGSGGGIYAADGSLLTIRDSRVYSNSAYNGGGLWLAGVLNARIERSEFYSNTADVWGGGILNISTYDFQHNPLTLVNSNLHNNFAGSGGGAISSYSTLVLSRTVLDANRAGYYGGGIWTTPGYSSNMLFQESTLSRNTAQFGGGIYYSDSSGSSSVMTLVNSTLSGNSVSHDGGGIYAIDGAKILLLNATIASNVVYRPFGQSYPARGGGLFITTTAIITAQNTLIGDNFFTNGVFVSSPSDCFTSATTSLHSLGYNLIGTVGNCTVSGTTFGNVTGQDPVLGPLQNNGGSTPTRAPLSGSPAIDAGTNAGCPATDQRGFRRPMDGDKNGSKICDIGAYEVPDHFVYLPLALKNF
jgi:fibronectin-binding autotransporter adhesin